MILAKANLSYIFTLPMLKVNNIAGNLQGAK